MDQVQSQKPMGILVLHTLKTLKLRKLRYAQSYFLHTSVHICACTHKIYYVANSRWWDAFWVGYKISLARKKSHFIFLPYCSCGVLYMVRNMKKYLLWAEQRLLGFAGGKWLSWLSITVWIRLIQLNDAECWHVTQSWKIFCT